MAQYKIRCRLAYHKIKNSLVTTFALGVRDGIFDNPLIFTTPPILQAAYEDLIDICEAKYAAYKQGGAAQKGPYYTARQNLMDALDELAAYVNTVADNNANTITTAGYEATKGSASEQLPPPTPVGIILKRMQTGELMSDCSATPGADYHGAFLSTKNISNELIITPNGQILMIEDDPLMQQLAPKAVTPAASGELVFIFDITKNRRKRYTNLQPGTTYYVYYYAGNAAGVSMISDPVSFLLW